MRLWITLPALLLSFSCSLQATLTLQPTGSADVRATFRLAPPAKQAWSSLRELDETLPTDPFDVSFLQKGLEPEGKVTAAGGATTLSLSVPDLRQYVPTWKAEGDVWEGTIDRATVRRWTRLTAWAHSPALDSLLPAPGAAVTEAEYRDLLVYLLGPGVAEAAARTLVDTSTVQLTLMAPRVVQAAPGALSISGRTIVYRWPLTRVLTLETPIRIKLVF